LLTEHRPYFLEASGVALKYHLQGRPDAEQGMWECDLVTHVCSELLEFGGLNYQSIFKTLEQPGVTITVTPTGTITLEVSDAD
jgi:hypothetical protein